MMEREMFAVATLVIVVIVCAVYSIYLNAANFQENERMRLGEPARSYWQWNAQMDNESVEPLMSRTFSDVFASYGIVSSPDPWQANIMFFHDVTYATSYMAKLHKQEKIRRKRDIAFRKSKGMIHIMGINGSDLLASKEQLPGIMLGRFVPTTFLLRDAASVQELRSRMLPENLYIVKKDIQQQKGLKIVFGEEDEINRAISEEFLICQELLQDPYCIRGRKVNLRIYMLLSFSSLQKGMRMWIFDDGFMYYTPELFVRGSPEAQRNITTGYIDRKVYEDNPLTLRDLSKHMGPEEYGRLWTNIVRLFRHVKSVYQPILTGLNAPSPIHGSTHTMYFGCDIAPDENLDVMLMEMNKGPDLDYKDERDATVKKKMVGAIVELLYQPGGVGSKQRSFIEI
jgi:Tubulin-tyrosine ligase family